MASSSQNYHDFSEDTSLLPPYKAELPEAKLIELHHFLNQNEWPELTLSDLRAFLKVERELHAANDRAEREYLASGRTTEEQSEVSPDIWERLKEAFPDNERIKSGQGAMSITDLTMTWWLKEKDKEREREFEEFAEKYGSMNTDFT